MKIAVLGSNGFIGSSITKYLSKNNTVVPVTRQTLNLLNQIEVRNFLKSNYFDVVINAAAIMTNSNDIQDTRNNLGIFMNFHTCSSLFGKFINTGSGAEFDRTLNIEYAKEYDIFDVIPQDSYGFGQNIKSRLCYEKRNFYTLRIFNCFGLGEPSTRLFPRLLSSVGKFNITNDRYFDYFSIQDLLKVIDNLIDNDLNTTDINCVYNKKYKISEVAKKFIDFHNLNIELNIESHSQNNYTGDGLKLEMLGLNLIGLDNGLKLYKEREI